MERFERRRHDIFSWDDEGFLNDVFVGIDIFFGKGGNEFMILFQGYRSDLPISRRSNK